MGYFSNGTEGMDYQARYCVRCANVGKDSRSIETDTPGCPVWDLHVFHQGEIPQEALDLFIPRTPDGLGNEQCEMFRPAPPEEGGERG